MGHYFNGAGISSNHTAGTSLLCKSSRELYHLLILADCHLKYLIKMRTLSLFMLVASLVAMVAGKIKWFDITPLCNTKQMKGKAYNGLICDDGTREMKCEDGSKHSGGLRPCRDGFSWPVCASGACLTVPCTDNGGAYDSGYLPRPPCKDGRRPRCPKGRGMGAKGVCPIPASTVRPSRCWKRGATQRPLKKGTGLGRAWLRRNMDWARCSDGSRPLDGTWWF